MLGMGRARAMAGLRVRVKVRVRFTVRSGAKPGLVLDLVLG